MFICLLITICLIFAPACIDHRGTPENPARTLTLEEEEGAICVGFTDLNNFDIFILSLFISLFPFSFHSTSFYSETSSSFYFLSVGSSLLCAGES